MLTKSQLDAYSKLSHFLRLKKAGPIIAGVSTRPNPLIVGPSGVGKTLLVQAFASNALKGRNDTCPMFVTDVGSWIPDGARAEPNTLRAIRDWVRDKVTEGGIIFIDEIDKLAGKTEWTRSVIQNVFALLDNRLEWLPYWGTEEFRKLRDKVLVVGAGTWQEAQKKALKDPSNVTRLGARMSHIEEVSEIGEELLFRFNANVIFLDPMIETEIQERICSIHKALELPVPAASEVARLASRASESGRQYRWIEAYLSRLIAKNPEVLDRNTRPPEQNDASAAEEIL